MHISELARMANTTARTVRHYHHVGLLAVPDNPGVRDYGFCHLARLLHIRWLVDSGVPLARIGELLPAGGPSSLEMAAEDLQAVVDGLDTRITDLQAQRARLAVMLASAREGRGGSPLPPALWEGYRQLVAEADPSTRPAIVREREMLEAAMLNGALPPWALAFGDESGVSVRRASVEKFQEFAALPAMDEQEFETRMPVLAREHLAWMVAQPWVDEFVARARVQFSDEELLAQLVDWCDAAYPHPHHRRYLRLSLQLLAEHYLSRHGQDDGGRA